MADIEGFIALWGRRKFRGVEIIDIVQSGGLVPVVADIFPHIEILRICRVEGRSRQKKEQPCYGCTFEFH